MYPKTYTYSKFVGWLSAIIFGSAEIVIIYFALTDRDPNDWPYFLFIFLLIAAVLAYFIKKLFIPALRGEIALEIDKEKVQDYTKRNTIYWDNVVEITEQVYRYGSVISFQLMLGDSPVGISTKWINCDTEEIINVMAECLENARRKKTTA